MGNNVTVTKNQTPEEGVKILNVVVSTTQRQSQNIGKWRSALQSAEATVQSLVPLFDLYEDLLLDPVLSSLVEKRILGVVKNKLLFIDNNGKEVDAVMKFIKLRNFRELRKEIQQYRFWGRNVIELIYQNNQFRYYAPPKKHIRLKEGRVTYNQYGTDGIDYRLPPYNKTILELGKWNDFGLLLKAAPYVIYKRGGFGDWANFAEIFGLPFREARYDGYNQTVRQQLENALEQMGSAGYAILPKEAELTLHESRNPQGSAELFDMLRNACNQELSVLILGQTETTTKTSGKLGGNDNTHEHTEDMINQSDMEDELAIMNELVKPILANLGLPVGDGEFVHREEDEKVSLTDKVDMFVKLKNEYKLPMSDDHVYEETGIPKPADYDAQIKAREQAAPPDPSNLPSGNPTGGPDKAKQKKQDAQLTWADKFRMALADFFDQAHES